MLDRIHNFPDSIVLVVPAVATVLLVFGVLVECHDCNSCFYEDVANYLEVRGGFFMNFMVSLMDVFLICRYI